MWRSLLNSLPRGYSLEEQDWQRRHRLLLQLLAAHVPGLAIFGFVTGHSPSTVAYAVLPQVGCVVAGYLLRHRRRTAAVLVTAGLVYSSTALVGLSNGAIEAHFHFFIIVGFIALYQDWAPFLLNILFTVISHGVGSLWQQNLIFSHTAGQGNPWLWSLIHGVGVLATCVGMMLFWRVTEESQQEKDALARRLADAEIGRRQFTSDLLVNLARRNQSMLYRQLDIINQLEESERDPDALAELFKLDHLTTRVRRNAESLLVLSGEQPARTWSDPVPLRDVLRAAIAETEDLDRVVFVVDERPAVAGNTVTDLTHLLAELTENAVRYSPPDTTVTVRTRANRQDPGGYVITVEDCGVGMPAADLEQANLLLARPPEVDLSVSQRLGFHVVARLAARHGIGVSLATTPGSGITAVVILPPALFEPTRPVPPAPLPQRRDRGRNGSQTMTASGPAGTATLLREPEDAVDARQAWPDRPPATFGSPAPFVSPGPSVGPGPSGSPGPFDDPAGFENQDWKGWWPHEAGPAGPASPPTPDTRPALPARPSPAPRSAPAAPGPPAMRAPEPPSAAPADPAAGLRRRVPQAHLAPELRQPVEDATAQAGPAPAIAGAAGALSRYQASREAARAASDDENGRRS